MKNTKEVNGKDFEIKRSSAIDRILSFKDDVCIGCGLCEDTCPVEAISLEDIAPIERNYADYKNTYFSGHDRIQQNEELFTNDNVAVAKIAIDEEACVLCGMCSGVCPASALDLTIAGESIKENEAYPTLIKGAEIDEDDCVFCKRCETACPRDAITIARTLPERKNLVTGEIAADADTCIKCGACAELCPAGAITVNKTPGEESITIDEDACVYCLVCKRVCPVDAITASCRSCSYGEYDLDPADAEITGSAIIDDDVCISCGWCEGVCPEGAATHEKPFKGSLVIDTGACGTCGACIDICPCDALSFPKSTGPGDRGTQLIIADDYCIRCGACAKACPNGALTVIKTDINHTPTSSKSWIAAFDALKN